MKLKALHVKSNVPGSGQRSLLRLADEGGCSELRAAMHHFRVVSSVTSVNIMPLRVDASIWSGHRSCRSSLCESTAPFVLSQFNSKAGSKQLPLSRKLASCHRQAARDCIAPDLKKPFRCLKIDSCRKWMMHASYSKRLDAVTYRDDT